MKRMTVVLIAISTVAVGIACSRPPAVVVDESAVVPVLDTAADEAAARRRAEEEAARRRAEEMARREAAWARDRATVEEMIFFDFDKAQIREETRVVLSAKARVLQVWPEVRLRVDGHADERGSTEYNLALGMRRAAAARRYLTDLGIAAERLEVASFGEEQPLDPRHTPTAWDRNRRAEFTILGDPIAGRE